MKKLFVLTFMFLFLSDLTIFAQSDDCYTPPYTWHRRVTQPVFKWYWDGQLNGAAFDEGTGDVLSTTEKQQIVRNAIIWAVNYWKVVVNSNGNVIEDMSEDILGNGNFHFTFTTLTNQLGQTDTSLNEIRLANNINITWTDNDTYDRAYDIKTVILHEIGHIFLGAGHSTYSSDDPRSLMWENYTVPFRSITQCDTQVILNLYPLFNITVDNNFTDNTGNGTHGKVGISGYLGDQTAPKTIKKSLGQSVTLTAISNQISNQNYQMIWNSGATNTSDWQRNGFPAYSNSVFTFTVSSSDDSAKYQAQLRKICNITFQNSFVGINNGGVINVNNIQYNSPTASFPVVEQNPITALAVSGQIINGISYEFDHWSTEGGTTSYYIFHPDQNKIYTAYYIGRPSRQDANLGYVLGPHIGTTVGQPVTLYWSEHPNPLVTQYQVWRKERFNGTTSSPHLLTTVNRGTTSYIDNDFIYVNHKTDLTLLYDVRPYYSLENTYAVESWINVFSEMLWKSSDSVQTSSTVQENSLSNFPNPFNPTTTIYYSIKEPSFVSVKVFDLIGQEVANLVNEEKEGGSHSINFNASTLPSGIYIYTIKAGNFTQSRKMLLMK